MSDNKICPRCGIKVCKIRRHLLNRKKPCVIKYVDVSQEEILNNYDKYLQEYNIKVACGLYTCKDCKKTYKYRQSLYVHKKQCNSQNNDSIESNLIENNIQQLNIITNNNINIVEDRPININSNNNLIINLQPFGNEMKPSYEDFINMIDKILQNNVHEILQEYFDLTFIKIPENRNTYLSHEKNGHGLVYDGSENGWILKPVDEIGNELLQNSKIGLYKMLENSECFFNNAINSRLSAAFKLFVENDDHDEGINDRTRKSKFKSLLVQNKDLMKNSIIISKKALEIKSLDLESLDKLLEQNKEEYKIIHNALMEDYRIKEKEKQMKLIEEQKRLEEEERIMEENEAAKQQALVEEYDRRFKEMGMAMWFKDLGKSTVKTKVKEI